MRKRTKVFISIISKMDKYEGQEKRKIRGESANMSTSRKDAFESIVLITKLTGHIKICPSKKHNSLAGMKFQEDRAALTPTISIGKSAQKLKYTGIQVEGERIEKSEELER